MRKADTGDTDLRYEEVGKSFKKRKQSLWARYDMTYSCFYDCMTKLQQNLVS